MTISEERLRILRANNSESHLETRFCIKSALIDLMQKKPYDKISMTDIINKSGVSRSGVYRNYKNKAEIMLEIVKEPIDEVISSFSDSIFENMEMIFRTGKKHEKAFKSLIDTGLEHNVLRLMNARYESVSVSYYIPLWIGIIYNSFFEWVRTGMSGSVETAIEKVKEGLKLVASSIETGLTNDTQNKRL